MLTGAVLLFAGAGVWAQGKTATETAPDAPIPVSYASATDQQLTQLAARWGELNALERRGLLSEMRSRMARSQADRRRFQAAMPRRYGRVFKGGVIKKVRKVRQPDGSIVVKTEVVQIKPKKQSEPVFGVGFERRSRGSNQPDDQHPPGVKVGTTPPASAEP